MPRRRQIALSGAALTAALLILTWLAAFHVGPLVRADEKIFSGFLDLHRGRIHSLATFTAQLCDPQPYVYFALLPPLIALVRRRFAIAVAVSAMLLGASVTTHLLKPLLAHTRADALLGGTTLPVAAASWPSGHATAAMALALAFVLVVPARLRPATATVGALFAIAVSYSFLTLGWHYPSDV